MSGREAFDGVRFETARLVLRSLRADDRDAIFEAFTPVVTRYMTPASPSKPAETEAFLARAVARMKAGRDLYGAILARDDERFLGCVGAHRLPGDDPDLGIWVREDAWGNGYGREAVEGILAWASARTIAPVFGYPVDERNVPSRRIATSLGGYRVGDPWTITTPDGRTLRVILYAIPRK